MRCLFVYRSFSGQRISDIPHRNLLKMKLRDAIRSLCQGMWPKFAASDGKWVVAPKDSARSTGYGRILLQNEKKTTPSQDGGVVGPTRCPTYFL